MPSTLYIFTIFLLLTLLYMKLFALAEKEKAGRQHNAKTWRLLKAKALLLHFALCSFSCLQYSLLPWRAVQGEGWTRAAGRHVTSSILPGPAKNGISCLPLKHAGAHCCSALAGGLRRLAEEEPLAL